MNWFHLFCIVMVGLPALSLIGTICKLVAASIRENQQMREREAAKARREEEAARRKAAREEERMREREAAKARKAEEAARKQAAAQAEAVRKAAQKKAQKESELSARVENASSLRALLAAMEKVRLYQDENTVSSPSLQLIGNGNESTIINNHIDRALSSIDEFSLRYVPFSEVKKKVFTWEQDMAKCYDALPPESQSHYRAEREKRLGAKEE